MLLAYALPATPLALLGLPLYVYLPSYYAGERGLGLAAVGLVLLLARLWDVVADPLVGIASDRFELRFGRRRPWLIAALPLLLLAVAMLFWPAEGSGLAYLLIWTMALYLAWTMLQLPYSAWGAELSEDYHERTRIAGVREAAAILGTVLAASLPLFLAGNGDQGQALAALGRAILLLMPVTVVIAVAAVPEPARRLKERLGFRSGVAALLRNHPLRRLIAAYLLNGIANALPATLVLLFIEHRLQARDWSGVLLLAYFLSGIAAVPLWLRLSRHLGKHRTWCVAMLWNVAIFALVPLLGAGDAWWFLLICIATGACLGADLTLPSAMWADVVDFDAAETGSERAGLFFALWGMATKLALALAVGIAFPLLDLAGFSTARGASPTGLWALVLLYSLVPVGFKLGAIGLLWGFEIGPAEQTQLRRRIESMAKRPG
ncbi:MAG: MFS transporter [Proteobacteria bacterium]|nr:MFS transporter [Pseudomonadota bacterium]MBI3497520.1 MFS transporter [Pseudomonadota bacterium]